ncbi:MAG: CDP-diacylglycerol--glycerol-3-phosphate 3-phosphatidyltransferase [Myxococcales bacterium]|jgi:CDP-diacylglycerol--glycerol-3-phosphate 3-phosphatidyltransferase|nr:CDP-diacylglycerol--glycerol-3-phosphate 3-phosphatidyltransferase [Myxococcales bacterium]
MANLKKEFLNLPNILTLARIVAIPFFIVFTLSADPRSSFWAAIIFGAASATDFLDGWLARRQGLVTVAGKFLDPLADKLIVMAALVMLVRLGRVASVLVILLLAREFIVTGLRTIAMSEGMVIAAGQGGKWKTMFQLTGISFLLLHFTYTFDFGPFALTASCNKVGTWLLWMSLIASVTSAVDYFKGFLDLMDKKEAQLAAASNAFEAAKIDKIVEKNLDGADRNP